MNQKLRIVHILFSFSTGGMEKGIAMLVNATHQQIEHIILCIKETGESERLLPKGSRVISLHKSDGNSILFLFRLARMLKELKPDIVHTRNWVGLDGVIAARMAGIKNIIHGEHGWGVADPDGRNTKRVFIRRVLSWMTKEYICVSRQMVPWLENDIGISRRRITQIYNGVDYIHYTPVKRNVSNNGIVIGAVGRLDPIKDHPTLFKAFEELKRSIPDATLMVVGDGPEREKLEKLAGDRIVFLGNRSDVPELMQTFDLFVLPSINEGISNTILEAMATGLPVLASRTGGNPELVEDGINGHLFDVGDWKHLAELMITYCIDRKKRSEHGKESRQIIVRDFSIDKMAKQYTSVWRRLARK